MLRRQTSANNPADWFELAAERLSIADLARANQGLTATGVECLQEAAERYLKGFLVAKGWTLEKTHDLERLVNAAASYDYTFNRFIALATELTEDFFLQHYPGNDMTSVGENYEQMRAQVGEMIILIKTTLPQYFPK